MRACVRMCERGRGREGGRELGRACVRTCACVFVCEFACVLMCMYARVPSCARVNAIACCLESSDLIPLNLLTAPRILGRLCRIGTEYRAGSAGSAGYRAGSAGSRPLGSQFCGRSVLPKTCAHVHAVTSTAGTRPGLSVTRPGLSVTRPGLSVTRLVCMHMSASDQP